MEGIHALLPKLEARDVPNLGEKRALTAAVEREVPYGPGELIVPEGVPQTASFSSPASRRDQS